MNLKELVNQSLNIEEQLREQYGVISIDKGVNGEVELHILDVEDFVSLTNGNVHEIKFQENIYKHYAKSKVGDFVAMILLTESELEELKELTK